jgi:hypothetical protein
MSYDALLRTLTFGIRLDASELASAVTHQLAGMLLSLDDRQLGAHLSLLADSPNFVGSDLFDLVVDRAPADLRHHMWVSGHASDEQARRHFDTETDPVVRQAMALWHDLADQDVRAALANPEKLADGAGILRMAQAITRGRGPHLPLDVLAGFLAGLDPRGPHYRLVGDTLAGNAALARTLLGHPKTPDATRWLALAESGVPAETVIKQLEAFSDGSRKLSVRAFAHFLRTRPVLTRAEWDAAENLLYRRGPEQTRVDALRARYGWELSESEFAKRAAAATTRSQLEDVAALVPEPRWGAADCLLVRAVVTHPQVTPELVEHVARRCQDGPGAVVGMWAPSEQVWDHQWLLMQVLGRVEQHEALDTDGFAAHRPGWRRVLSGPRAHTFTAQTAASPRLAHPRLWEMDVPWVGDLNALAFGVPAALALRVRSSALLAAVLNTIGEADGGTGTLWALFDGGTAGAPATVGDILAVHAAATT